ncbi:hypothetical protein E2C01_010747 [Portunus trituberculatus]|uniref:Uncharacterized protein n=1 Tax=Portunus trituberculatus TaxID=210409 RepID=A0A5B7D987_PORTR|nr:hypothetical protein [Portunus trituberculatus]
MEQASKIRRAVSMKVITEYSKGYKLTAKKEGENKDRRDKLSKGIPCSDYGKTQLGNFTVQDVSL